MSLTSHALSIRASVVSTSFCAHGSPHRAALRELDDGTCWDTVLVDSPEGKWQHDPSRAVPIYTARLDTEACAARRAYAAKGYATVWVHDCNRPGEDLLTRELLGPSFSRRGRKNCGSSGYEAGRACKTSYT